MYNIFLVLFLVSFFALVLGLIQPAIISRLFKHQMGRKKIGLIFGGAAFIFTALGGMITDSSSTNTNQPTQTANVKFVKVTSFTGNQSGKSEEFVISSKDIKFVYQCDGGPYICLAWLKQVGGAGQKLFRSAGNTGTLSEQKILSVGPGTFYIEMDTADRAYKIDVSQGGTPASTEELANAQNKLDVSNKYRNISGFKLTDENSDYLTYNYQTSDGTHSVQLTVFPEMTNYEFDSGYAFAKGNLTVNGVDIQYAFEVSQLYESAEFMFVAGNKAHVGFVRNIDFNSDQAGIELALKSFVNALVPNI